MGLLQGHKRSSDHSGTKLVLAVGRPAVYGREPWNGSFPHMLVGYMLLHSEAKQLQRLLCFSR